MIFFVGGLNGYIWVEWYTLYLRMLAAHGFFIIGVDYKFPANPHTYDNKLSQDVSKFFQEIDFVSWLCTCNWLLMIKMSVDKTIKLTVSSEV